MVFSMGNRRHLEFMVFSMGNRRHLEFMVSVQFQGYHLHNILSASGRTSTGPVHCQGINRLNGKFSLNVVSMNGDWREYYFYGWCDQIEKRTELFHSAIYNSVIGTIFVTLSDQSPTQSEQCFPQNEPPVAKFFGQSVPHPKQSFTHSSHNSHNRSLIRSNLSLIWDISEK